MSVNGEEQADLPGEEFNHPALLVSLPALKGTNASEFFKLLDRTAELVKWTPKQCKNIAVLKCEGAAKIFFDSAVQHEEIEKYEDFKTRFLIHFADKRPFALTLSEFTNCVQGSGESIKDFATRLQGLSHRCLNCPGEEGNGMTTQFRQKLMLSQFVNGVREEIRAQLLLLNPQTWEKAVEDAARVEGCRWASPREVHAVQSEDVGQFTRVLQTATASYTEIIKNMREEMEALKLKVDELSRVPRGNQRNNGNYSGPRNNNNNAQNRLICFYCGLSGHVVRECLKKQSDQRNGAINRRPQQLSRDAQTFTLNHEVRREGGRNDYQQQNPTAPAEEESNVRNNPFAAPFPVRHPNL